MVEIGSVDQKLGVVRTDGQHPIPEDSVKKQGSGPGDVVVPPGAGAPVVVPLGEEPPSLAALAAARKGKTHLPPVAELKAQIPGPPKPNFDATVRSFFSAYERADPEAMRQMLAAKTVYEDPVFPHLEDAQVARMWKSVAGGSTKVRPQIDRVVLGEHSAEVDWVAKYKFLGASIENHIHSSFTFDDAGKITGQKDSFDWRAWGNQMWFPLNLLLRSDLGQRLVQWWLGRQIEDQSAR